MEEREDEVRRRREKKRGRSPQARGEKKKRRLDVSLSEERNALTV